MKLKTDLLTSLTNGYTYYLVLRNGALFVKVLTKASPITVASNKVLC